MPSYTIVLRIAIYSQVSLDWLLTAEEPKEPWASAVREEEALYKAPPICISANTQWKEPLPHQISDKGRIFIPMVSEGYHLSANVYVSRRMGGSGPPWGSKGGSRLEPLFQDSSCPWGDEFKWKKPLDFAFKLMYIFYKK